MVTEDKKVSAIIDEQFRRFREEKAPELLRLDEKLDEVGRRFRVQNMADAKFAVHFQLFTRELIQTAQWN